MGSEMCIRDSPELNKQNLPFGFKVNAWKEVPENNPQDWVYKTTNPGDMYGSIADQFTPEVFKDYVLKSSDTGATLFGGCCEIKPKHIKALICFGLISQHPPKSVAPVSDDFKT